MSVSPGHDGPNSRQIGGDHYAKEWQHWDFVEDWGLGYLECVATKYLCRWRQKDGLKDLEKALHYIDKLIDRHKNNQRMPKACVSFKAIRKFSKIQNLDIPEETALGTLCRWSDICDLYGARDIVERLLIQENKLSSTGMEHPFGYEESDDAAG